MIDKGEFVPMELAACTPGYIQVLEHVLFREGLEYFNKTVVNHILHLVQQHDFVVEESRCWNGLLTVQTFHQWKSFLSIIKHKTRQTKARTVEQLESHIRPE